MKRKMLIYRMRLRRTFRSKRVKFFGRGVLLVLFCIGIGTILGFAYAVFDNFHYIKDNPSDAAANSDWGRRIDLTLEGAINGCLLGCLACLTHFVLTHPPPPRHAAEPPPDYDSSSVWPPPPSPESTNGSIGNLRRGP